MEFHLWGDIRRVGHDEKFDWEFFGLKQLTKSIFKAKKLLQPATKLNFRTHPHQQLSSELGLFEGCLL